MNVYLDIKEKENQDISRSMFFFHIPDFDFLHGSFFFLFLFIGEKKAKYKLCKKFRPKVW